MRIPWILQFKIKLWSGNYITKFSQIKIKAIETNESYNIPKNLNNEKLKEIINVLFDKTKFYLNKLREDLGIPEGEKLQIYAESLGFDYIYENFGYEREIIEKALSIYKLKIVEK